MRLRKLLVLILGLMTTFALVAAACGNDDDDGDAIPDTAGQTDAGDIGDAGSTADDGAQQAPADEAPAGSVSGSVTISGSSTVEPISVRVAELFENVQPDVQVTVDGPGTGDGFKLFCEGETDISDASRQIKDSEAEACAANGIDWIELRVGIDGIAVMTGEGNSVECVTFNDIYGLVGPESTGFGSWSDAGSLGLATSSLPDVDLDIYGPGEESGTFDSFIEIVLEDIADERGQDATTRPDYNANADDNVIIQGIQSSDTSFGWVGFAFAAHASGVKLLDVDGGGGCVSANADTIASGEYPVSRSLYIYVNKAKADASPAVTAYVDYYMSDDGLGTAVSDVGYVNLTNNAKDDTRSNWTNRTVGGSQAAAAPEVTTEQLSGSVTISGSSTVEPISVRVAELFESVQPDVAVTVDGPGTGDGFKLFCEGETDISDASRQIKDSEAEACAASGIEFVELRVGIDGIAVMTGEGNPVECVTFNDIYGLVGPESTGFGSWSDAGSLGLETSDLPDVDLDIYGPGEESGTFDSFIEIVLEDIADERGQDATTRPDYNANADDNVIIQGIQSSDTSFGWVGFAFAAHASGVKLLDVDGGGGCVGANADTIASGEYPVSRSLYIYVNKAKAEANPALVAYVDYYMSDDGLGTAVSDVGYVNLTDDAKGATRANWAGR